MRKLRTWREYLIKQLTANRDEALDYIQFALEEYQIDGDTPVLLLSLKTFIESQGGVEKVAQCTGIDPETLLEILSSEEAPRVDTLGTILRALGCRLSIQPLKDDENATVDSEPAAEAESTKFADSQVQLAESDSLQ